MPSTRALTPEAIRSILGLVRAERNVDPATRVDLSSARQVLEDLVGPSVRPADAARFLGVTQPAVHRWLEKGEISTVRTPEGRREIPLSEFINLLDEVERARDDGALRPLALVLKERGRQSAESIDIDRLLPRRRRGHRTAELHSLAYHRLISERLDDELIGNAERRLRRWIRDGRIDPRWATEWERILALSPAQMAKAIASDSPKARQLRQSSPFAGVLTPQERRRIGSAVEGRAT